MFELWRAAIVRFLVTRKVTYLTARKRITQTAFSQMRHKILYGAIRPVLVSRNFLLKVVTVILARVLGLLAFFHIFALALFVKLLNLLGHCLQRARVTWNEVVDCVFVAFVLS
jgi:hypothetical protein